MFTFLVWVFYVMTTLSMVGEAINTVKEPDTTGRVMHFIAFLYVVLTMYIVVRLRGDF